MRHWTALVILCLVLGGWTHGVGSGGAPVVNSSAFVISSPVTNGGPVGTATCASNCGGITWSITGGNSAGNFAINSSTGAITTTSNAVGNLVDPHDGFSLTIQASNGSTGSNTASVDAYSDGSVNVGGNGYVQHANFFTGYAQQNGQSWNATRPPWKAPGVDYAVGMISNAAISITSPAVITETAHGHVAGDKVYFFTTGTLPTGLTASNTNGLTPYFVLAAGLTTNSYEVSTTSGGTAVTTSGTQSGFHTALKDPATDALPSGCTFSATNPNVTCTGNGATFNYWFFHDIYLQVNNCTTGGSVNLSNNYFEIGTNTIAHGFNFEPIQVGGINNCTLTSSNNVYDGNAINLGATAQNMPGHIFANVTNSITFKYDAWINTLFRGIDIPVVASNVTMEYMYAEGTNYNNGGGHGEFIILNDAAGTWASFNILFNTALAPNNFGGGYTAFWYIAGGGGAPSQAFTLFNFDYNITAANNYEFVGGISNGSGGAGTILNITSSAGNQFIGPCSAAGNNNPMATTGGVTAHTSITSCGTGTGGAGTYGVNVSQFIAPGTTMAINVGGQGITMFDTTNVTTANVIGNYFDPTGLSSSTYCINAANFIPTITGNINLLDGSTVDLTHCNGHF